jgi:hypothetical protein
VGFSSSSSDENDSEYDGDRDRDGVAVDEAAAAEEGVRFSFAATARVLGLTGKAALAAVCSFFFFLTV